MMRRLNEGDLEARYLDHINTSYQIPTGLVPVLRTPSHDFCQGPSISLWAVSVSFFESSEERVRTDTYLGTYCTSVPFPGPFFPLP